MVIVYGMLVLGCGTTKNVVSANFSTPNETVEDHAYLIVDDGGINIIFIDNMLSGIPAQKDTLILLPAGEHTIDVQWISAQREVGQGGGNNTINITTKFEWTGDMTEITFNFNSGKYYVLSSVSAGNGRAFSISEAPADSIANKQKMITSFSMPKDSKWGYHNIDRTRPTKFDGIWEFVEGSYNGKPAVPGIQAPFIFMFAGNYMQYVNLGGMANINMLRYVALNTTGGLFEFTDNQITLYKYAVHIQKTTEQVRGQTLGWLCDENIMGKRQTEQFTYTLDGNDLIIDGAMGFKLILRKTDS